MTNQKEIEEYWFSASECLALACKGDLKVETRKDRKVLVCTKCGTINASIERDKK